ncbi:MAG TPA: hypothetical protein VGM95_05460 [Lactobacillaceae bacterium]
MRKKVVLSALIGVATVGGLTYWQTDGVGLTPASSIKQVIQPGQTVASITDGAGNTTTAVPGGLSDESLMTDQQKEALKVSVKGAAGTFRVIHKDGTYDILDPDVDADYVIQPTDVVRKVMPATK